jgi:antitoxin ParD1/3/4
MNVDIGEHFDTFIRKQVESGQYANASEVVREALQRLEDQVKLREIRRLVAEADEAIARGDTFEWTPELMDEMIREADEAERRGLPIPDHVKP